MTRSTAAQITWTEKVVSPQTDFAMSVYGTDVDGDGDVDVFASALQQSIAWHENVDGDGSTWIEHTIAPDSGIYFVVGADIDGDGDMDAVTGGLIPDPAVWFENAAGDGSTWTRHVITSAAITLRSVHAADVDGDKDLDVLVASESSGQVLWYENTTGLGSSWISHEIGLAGIPLSVVGADMDGDADIDAAVADSTGDAILWFENLDGSGNLWNQRIISLAADGAHSVCPADVDEDGDLDVMSASFKDNKVAWHENLNAIGTSWAEHPINAGGGDFISIAAADIDNDGDLDAVSASFDVADMPPAVPAPVTWYENVSGDGMAWADRPITNSPGKTRQAFPVDVDGDCDIDVLSTSSTANQVFWHENSLATGSTCPGTWTDLAGGTSGVNGVPALLGTGPLTSGSLVTLTLTNTPPNGLVLLFISVASNPQSLFGGTLHAFPAAIDLTLQADASGTLVLQGNWPAGLLPPGAQFWFQYLLQDASSVYGKTLSNGVVATPP